MKTRFGKVPFDRLSDDEKEAIWRECERVRAEDGGPLTKKDIQLHRKAGLRPGRPRVGLGAKRINISVERRLLTAADAFARKRGMSRARLFADSLKAFLGKAA